MCWWCYHRQSGHKHQCCLNWRCHRLIHVLPENVWWHWIAAGTRHHHAECWWFGAETCHRSVPSSSYCYGWWLWLRVTRPFVARLQAGGHSFPDDILNWIRQDIRLVDHCVMHSLVEHFLELSRALQWLWFLAALGRYFSVWLLLF
jgi:hypothetical protein